jgi:hypothetical protein
MTGQYYSLCSCWPVRNILIYERNYVSHFYLYAGMASKDIKEIKELKNPGHA